jgi:Tfp pilus assembly protein PilO
MTLSTREKAIAVVAGVAVLLLGLNFYLVEPLLERRSRAQAAIAAAQRELLEAAGLFDNDLRARRRWNEMTGQTLRTDGPTAESQLLNNARQWGQEAGLVLTSLKPERNERELEFQRITIRATATGNMQSVTRFLYAIETSSMPVRISDVQIVSRREGSDELSMQVGLSTIYLPPIQQPQREVAR